MLGPRADVDVGAAALGYRLHRAASRCWSVDFGVLGGMVVARVGTQPCAWRGCHVALRSPLPFSVEVLLSAFVVRATL